MSAERLKRRFAKEIQSDPETFRQCADTIIRHVGDIGRMVDEFSAFARMPQPVIKPEDLGRIVREALMLQQTARPGIDWQTDDSGPRAGRALRPAADRPGADQPAAERRRCGRDAHGTARAHRDGGRIGVTVEVSGLGAGDGTDDGVGLPQEDRARLTEPYVTHKPKGTGLGLAIVKKIMEDHGGTLSLDDRPDGPGAVATLVLPQSPAGPPAAAGRGQGCRMAHEILIVDDEPDIRMLIDGILQDEGYETRGAGDADGGDRAPSGSAGRRWWCSTSGCRARAWTGSACWRRCTARNRMCRW